MKITHVHHQIGLPTGCRCSNLGERKLIAVVAGVGTVVVVAASVAPEAHTKIDGIVSIQKEFADDLSPFEKLKAKAEGA